MSSFLQPAPGLDPPPLYFTTLGLEFFHFYLTQTSIDLLGHNLTWLHVWKADVVKLSLQYRFLLRVLFSLASLYLVYLHGFNTKLTWNIA
jgi:hypothetical protein